MLTKKPNKFIALSPRSIKKGFVPEKSFARQKSKSSVRVQSPKAYLSNNPKISVAGPHAPLLQYGGGNLGHPKRADHIKSAFTRGEQSNSKINRLIFTENNGTSKDILPPIIAQSATRGARNLKSDLLLNRDDSNVQELSEEILQPIRSSMRSPRDVLKGKKTPRMVESSSKTKLTNNYFLNKQKTEKVKKSIAVAIVPSIDLNSTQKNLEFKKSNVPLIQPLNLNYTKTPHVAASLNLQGANSVDISVTASASRPNTNRLQGAAKASTVLKSAKTLAGPKKSQKLFSMYH